MGRLHAYILANAAIHDIASIRENLEPKLRQQLIKLGPRLSQIYAAAAPKKTGKLAAEIRSEFTGIDAIQIISPVKSATGFSYTRITRFGHNVAFIYPRKARALRFEIGGRTIFAKRVRGVHVDHDWADTGFPLARNEVISAAKELAASL